MIENYVIARPFVPVISGMHKDSYSWNLSRLLPFQRFAPSDEQQRLKQTAMIIMGCEYVAVAAAHKNQEHIQRTKDQHKHTHTKTGTPIAIIPSALHSAGSGPRISDGCKVGRRNVFCLYRLLRIEKSGGSSTSPGARAMSRIGPAVTCQGAELGG